jgi:chemotaxis protein methyltransferase CheR
MSLSATSFDYVRSVLRERTGNVLADDKVYLVETRLFPVARQRGFATVEALVARLRATSSPELLQQVLDAMTINETSFFRDGRPFDDLREHVLPDLIRCRASERRLHLWSSACATGQEPFSLVLLLRQHFPELEGWTIRVLASDLSPSVLSRARRGWYSALEVARGVPAEMLARFFHPAHDGWQVNDEVRRQIEFLNINLVERWPVLPLLDLVLMRNVLIYFDLSTRQQVLAQVRRVLRPDGYLLLGGAETTHNVDEEFEAMPAGATSVYRLRQPTGEGCLTL